MSDGPSHRDFDRTYPSSTLRLTPFGFSVVCTGSHPAVDAFHTMGWSPLSQHFFPLAPPKLPHRPILLRQRLRTSVCANTRCCVGISCESHPSPQGARSRNLYLKVNRFLKSGLICVGFVAGKRATRGAPARRAELSSLLRTTGPRFRKKSPSPNVVSTQSASICPANVRKRRWHRPAAPRPSPSAIRHDLSAQRSPTNHIRAQLSPKSPLFCF